MKLILMEYLKKFIIYTFLIVMVVILVVGALYIVTYDDAEYRESWDSTNYGAREFMNNTSINEDGTITSNMTAQELWDKLVENGSRVELYLDSPEELARLMKAEMVTKYPDLREDPDEEINWEEIIHDPDAIQGIIKFIRSNNNNEKTTMSYVKPEEFQSYIDEYNRTGSETAKENALKHFTLKRAVVGSSSGGSSSQNDTSKVSSFDGMLFIGDSFTVGLENAHTSEYYLTEENITLLENALFSARGSTTPQYWLERVDTLPATGEVNSVCVLLGVNAIQTQDVMKQLIDKLQYRYNGKNIYIQRVFPVGTAYTTVSDMNSLISRYNTDIENYCETKENVYFIDTTQGYITSDGYLDPGKSMSDGLHLTDYNTWVDNIKEQVLGDENSGATGGLLCWPTTTTNITSQFGYRDSPTAGASSNHKGIDIGVPSGSEVYACEAGTVTSASYNSSAGNMVVIDHGNGYVSRYLHNSEYVVATGDRVTKGQVVAISGSTGISTGPHLHFEIRQNDTPIDPLSFKYDNGQGNGTGGFGTNSSEMDESRRGTTTEVSGDGYSQEYTSSAGITYKEFKQFEGSYSGESYWEGTIRSDGCGPTSVAILASGLTSHNYTPSDTAREMMERSGYTGSGPLKEEMDSLGMECEIINSPSAEVIQDNLRNGKVMLVSVGAATIFTNNSHIMTIIDINDEGQVYISNPGNTNKNGWYDISEIMVDCDYIITTEAGSGSTANSSGNNNIMGYVAVVATWRQQNTTLTTNDPNVEAYSTVNYTMTTQNINYEEMANKYKMPFDLLWDILVVGESKNLVFDLADLVYGSDIKITIYDNLTTNTNIDEWHYRQQRKAVINGAIAAICNGISAQDFLNNHIHDPDWTSGEYLTVKRVVTKTNTINAVLTRANVWYVDYKNDYQYVEPTETRTDSTNEVGNTEYPDSPNRTGTSYSCSHIQAMITNLTRQVLSQMPEDNNTYTEDDVRIIYNLAVLYYERYINIANNITNIINTQKYIEGVPEIIEKIDEDTEPNFVTIFNKRRNLSGRTKIESVAGWLFDILEENNITSDWVDLIKYLMYKATGTSYGVREFNYEAFDPNRFEQVQDSNESSSGVTSDIISFIEAFEGGSQYIEGDTYIVYTNGIDNCYNLGPGIVVGTFSEGSWYPDILPNVYEGLRVEKAIYEQIFEMKMKGFTDALDAAIARYGVTLRQHQYDAMISFLYNCGAGRADALVSSYASGGDQGYWNYTSQFVNGPYGYLPGLERRRREEFELFTTGDYSIQ